MAHMLGYRWSGVGSSQIQTSYTWLRASVAVSIPVDKRTELRALAAPLWLNCAAMVTLVIVAALPDTAWKFPLSLATLITVARFWMESWGDLYWIAQVLPLPSEIKLVSHGDRLEVQ